MYCEQFGSSGKDSDLYLGDVRFESLMRHRLKRNWEDNIRMDLREVGWEGVDWMHLAQDRD
jgi:hypothetical protein